MFENIGPLGIQQRSGENAFRIRTEDVRIEIESHAPGIHGPEQVAFLRQLIHHLPHTGAVASLERRFGIIKHELLLDSICHGCGACENIRQLHLLTCVGIEGFACKTIHTMGAAHITGTKFQQAHHEGVGPPHIDISVILKSGKERSAILRPFAVVKFSIGQHFPA